MTEPRARPRRRRLRLALGVLAVACALLGAKKAWTELRPLPAPFLGDVAAGERAFLESDLGSGAYASVPRVVYEALPSLYPEDLPEGWAGAGLLTRPDDPDGPPVGGVRTSVLGLEAYATNCAVCHVGRFQGTIVPGAPNYDLDMQRMGMVFAKGVLGERLTVEAIARDQAARGRPLSALDRARVVAWLFFARERTKRLPARPFLDQLGPGRSDALNLWKRTLGIPTGAHVTWVDIPPVFNQKLKTSTLFDGSVTGDMAVRVMLTELQKGRPFRDPLLNRRPFDDIAAYVEQKLTPPRWPGALDAAKVARGRGAFEATCAGCHGTYGEAPTYPNKRVPLDRVGTDPERALAMTPEVKDALGRVEYQKFLRIDPQAVYLAPPLDGVWLTAPYLHNGSVPTLWHLLHPLARPTTFVRRFNDFDPLRVGLVCRETSTDGGTLACPPDDAQAKHDPRVLWTFDARVVGNSNAGHRFGEGLDEDEKWAVLEYLKTL